SGLRRRGRAHRHAGAAARRSRRRRLRPAQRSAHVDGGVGRAQRRGAGADAAGRLRRRHASLRLHVALALGPAGRAARRAAARRERLRRSPGRRRAEDDLSAASALTVELGGPEMAPHVFLSEGAYAPSDSPATLGALRETREAPRSPAAFVRQERPAFVIAPSAPDGEIAWRVALAPESEPPHEPDRRAIAGLAVGFEPMETQRSKRMTDHEREALGNQALPLPRHERVIAEVRATERAPDDLTDVHDADERAAVASADEKTDVRRTAQASKIGAIGGGRGGRRGPPRGEAPAAPHRRPKIPLPSPRP